ncbi:hypothetical protein C0J52_09801 [Blattella germanica]|nr:hypothetical protein C0J52_09801 [Blattella germanica]
MSIRQLFCLLIATLNKLHVVLNEKCSFVKWYILKKREADNKKNVLFEIVILVWRKFSQKKNLATIIFIETNSMLNPIESAWSCLKVAVKRNLSMQLPQILAGEDRVNISQYE